MHHQFIVCALATTITLGSLTTSVSGRPTSDSDNLVRHKRQSDQRLAELETILALQKYRHHRLRGPQPKGSQAGYGIIDFTTLGRRKKSTIFSPGVRISQTMDDDTHKEEEVPKIAPVNYPEANSPHPFQRTNQSQQSRFLRNRRQHSRELTEK